MSDEVLVNFFMPRNWLFQTVLWIHIYVVTGTVPQEIAAFDFNLPDQVFSFHRRISLIS